MSVSIQLDGKSAKTQKMFAVVECKKPLNS